MIPGSSPDDRTSGLTGGPGAAPTGPAPAGTASPADLPAQSPAARSPAARPRLQALAGLTVRGADGRRAGRVRDVYQHDASGRLAALTVLPRQLSARSVLIPARAIASLPPEDGAAAVASSSADGSSADGSSADGAADAPAPREVVLRVDAATAKAGLRPPDTLHATPELLAEALAALGDLAPAPSAAEGDAPAVHPAAAHSPAATPSAAPAPDGEESAEA